MRVKVLCGSEDYTSTDLGSLTRVIVGVSSSHQTVT